MLSGSFADVEVDITEENVQSRIRGVTLMALSNKFGPMLLTTGNKSEMSVGYATIYGDMAGGYNPLKDAYKMTVFAISKWRNAQQAEARARPGRPGDARRRSSPGRPRPSCAPTRRTRIRCRPIRCSMASCSGWSSMKRSVDQLVDEGFARETVVRIERLLHLAEYKRRQAPPGVKLGTRNFGRDRRYPISHAFRQRMSRHHPFRPIAYRHTARRQCPHRAAQLAARQAGGRAVHAADRRYRSERSREEHVGAIKADLEWLGLHWDGEERQSARFDLYEAEFAKLVAAGRVYRCYETAQELDLKRKVLLGRGLPPIYDRAGAGAERGGSCCKGGGGRGTALALPARPRCADRMGGRDPRSAALRSGEDVRSGGAPRRRVVALPAALGDRRHRDGHHRRAARRGPCFQHRDAGADVRRARARAAALRARGAAGRDRGQAFQAARLARNGRHCARRGSSRRRWLRCWRGWGRRTRSIRRSMPRRWRQASTSPTSAAPRRGSTRPNCTASTPRWSTGCPSRAFRACCPRAWAKRRGRRSGPILSISPRRRTGGRW